MTILTDVSFKADLGTKASTSTITELEDGALLIEGFGALYDVDREDEAFEDGAFSRGLKSFLESNAPLCYHHRLDHVIGKVIEAVPVSGHGIKLKAVVDFQPESSPLHHIYMGIKRGRIDGFSVGGYFKRRMTKAGPRIHDVDIVEWSATAAPVGRNAKFSVIAGKALEMTEKPQDEVPPTPETPPVEETPPTPETPPEPISIPLGSIGAEHLSEDLRSALTDLKPEARSLEELEQDIEELTTIVGQLTAYLETQNGPAA